MRSAPRHLRPTAPAPKTQAPRARLALGAAYGVAFGVTLCAALCAAAPARAQDPGPPRALLKLGLEHDSNARRQTGDALQADQLLRMFLKVAAPWSLGRAGTLQTKLLLGAKAYQDTPDEDTLVTTLNLGWALPLVRDPDHRLTFTTSADGSDRSESTSRRDYTRYAVSGGLSYRAWDTAQLYVGGGYRTFLFKPDLTSNHSGGSAAASLSASLGGGWALATQYSLVHRAFSSERLAVSRDGAVISEPGVARRDWLHAWDVSVTWQDAALVRARYTAQVNTSNSLGSGLTRHITELFWVQPLPWSLSLQVRGSLLRTQFDSFALADRTLQLDDENRNQLLVSARYQLPTPSVGLEARYALYTQALGEDAHFVRHLLLFGLVLTLDDLDADPDAPPLE